MAEKTIGGTPDVAKDDVKKDKENGGAVPKESSGQGTAKQDYCERKDVVYKLADISPKMTNAWKEIFKKKKYFNDKITVHEGDIFKGAPAADAIVSPANSFGFMDGGIDMAFSMHFGWQLSARLQKVIREEYDGEILVGQSVIIPIFEPGEKEPDDIKQKWTGCNDNKPIKWLISAPTMRVPQDVSKTSNAFLAFRGIILEVDKHNKTHGADDQIRSVLCPGLGTAVGRMPGHRCAFQMREAYQAHALQDKDTTDRVINPEELDGPWIHGQMMQEISEEEGNKDSYCLIV